MCSPCCSSPGSEIIIIGWCIYCLRYSCIYSPVFSPFFRISQLGHIPSSMAKLTKLFIELNDSEYDCSVYVSFISIVLVYIDSIISNGTLKISPSKLTLHLVLFIFVITPSRPINLG